jgi:hypothetical protein
VALFAFLSILCAVLCLPRIATTPGVRGSSSTINESLDSGPSYQLPAIINPETEHVSEESTLAVDVTAEYLSESPTLNGTEES